MIASSGRTELNGILAFIPDGGDDPNNNPPAYCRVTLALTCEPRPPVLDGVCRT
jgi:hypothetical protein